MREDNGRRRDRGSLQHQAEHARPRRQAPIASYLVILFAAAFLLLLMAYFQQQRQNDQTSDALNKSVSAVGTIQNMMDDNEALRARVSELESRVDELSRVQQEKEELETQITSLGRRVDAMQYFWQIDDYYARKYYTQAKNLIEQFEALGLDGFLDEENTTGTDRFSPAQRYREIRDALY